MAEGKSVRSIVSFVWRECGVALPIEEQPKFYLELEGLVRQAVEQRVRDELRRRIYAQPSQN